MLQQILSALWPPSCGRCQDPVLTAHTLCIPCWQEITFMTEQGCHICGLPMPEYISFDDAKITCGECLAQRPAFTMARAAAQYDDGIRPLLLALKHGGRHDLVGVLTQMLSGRVEHFPSQIDMVVAVPLHPRRYIKRGFNQSADLARALAKRHGLKFLPNGVLRKKHTVSQGGLSRSQRRKNMQNAFLVSKANQSKIAGQTVLLIDDVMTTGATIESVCKALQAAGARDVYVLTVARVVT